MRCATPYYERFARFAVTLTPAAIRAATDADAVSRLEARLRRARYPTVDGQLGRVFDRAQLGELIDEATNRVRQLNAGERRPPGPRFDPKRLPDDRLEVLIQTHHDMAIVEALRAERTRRAIPASEATSWL